MASTTGEQQYQNLRSAIVQVLENISKDTRDLLIGNHVKVYEGDIDSVKFLRDHVGCSQPCLVRTERTVQTWPALSRWASDEYLLKKLENIPVTVAMTPNGLADCPIDDDGKSTFTLPHYSQMPFNIFHRDLTQERNTVITYLQQQDSSLTKELPMLLDDITRIPWAEECLVNLEALNFWMGKSPTKTSWHRDHFENIYVVLRGCKVVRLLPPTDSYRMKVKAYAQSTWLPENNCTAWKLKPSCGNNILWSSLMPCSCLESRNNGLCDSCKHLYPRMPLEIEVHAGDALYIPSTWYHEIHHKNTGDLTIAVNFWYDMIHDSKYASMLAVDKIAQILGVNEHL